MSTVLHVVVFDTKFSATSFTDRETTNGIWNLFVKIWVSPYLGYLDALAHDQSPQFTSFFRANLHYRHGFASQTCGVEIYNALGVNECHHAYFRSIYHKVNWDDPGIENDLALSIALKATNDTAGSSVLVSTLFAFGSISQLSIQPPELPDRGKRLQQIPAARK